VLITSLYSLYKNSHLRLPSLPYRANIPKAWKIPEGAEQATVPDHLHHGERRGEKRSFALENYPGLYWQFIDSKTVQTKEGLCAAHPRLLYPDGRGRRYHRRGRVAHKGYTILPHLAPSGDGRPTTATSAISTNIRYAQAQKIPFYCLTASTEKGIQHWEDITGAEYPFYMTDATTLKTIIRSNPGLLLIKDGTIIRKWSHNDLPTGEELNAPLDKLEIGHLPNDTVGKTITKVVLWFFLPLILLTIADRTWAWSKYVRGKIRDGQQRLKEEEKKLMDNKTSTKFISTFKKETNEKENCSG
jgi:triosephosphate isomerase